jgi:ferredoxin-NADP reductase
MPDRILTVRVQRITPQTSEISAFELVHPWGRDLPGHAAGAHIDVHTPGGFKRQYSLARAASAGAPVPSYLIGVKHEAASRGGSAALHQQVREGDLLAISAPRNSFPLRKEARHHLLLAGGIGLTPLLAMAQELAAGDKAFTLCVFARSRGHLPFAHELAALAPHVRLHFDEASAPEKIHLPGLLAEFADATGNGAQAYLCGPAGFMRAARLAATDAMWPQDAIHAEYFAAPDTLAGSGRNEPFELQLARGGQRVAVRADQSAVEALREIGIEVPTSCEQGLCGSCVVAWQPGVAGGEPEHRDFCLAASERLKKVALCCARGRGGPLIVDL